MKEKKFNQLNNIEERILTLEQVILFSALSFTFFIWAKDSVNQYLLGIFLILTIFFGGLAAGYLGRIAAVLSEHYLNKIYIFYTKHKKLIDNLLIWSGYLIILFLINWDKDRKIWQILLQVIGVILLDLIKNKIFKK